VQKPFTIKILSAKVREVLDKDKAKGADPA